MSFLLGTVQIGLDYGVNNSTGKPTLEQSFELLSTAAKNNVKTLDTAEAYGNSHEIIGKYHIHNPRFNICTKLVFPNKDYNLENFENKIIKLKKEMNIEEIEVLYFHHFKDFKNFPKDQNWQKVLKDYNIKSLGVSVYTADEIKEVLNYPFISSIQVNYNVLDFSEDKILSLKIAKKKGVKVYARSIYLQGLFFKDPVQMPNWPLEITQALEDISLYADKFGITVQELVLAGVRNSVFIDHIILGAESTRQIIENANLFNHPSDGIDCIFFERFKNIEPSLLDPRNWSYE